ncbi:hypothetical protein H2Y54_00400 [Pectobacterium aroidearum]|uniref:hypothetical protein n=1 Tax=Pectobacterium aroidearum TaxID=1201031 RepID=UPI0015F0EE25|nr:hypothetical protein [Pectobacterium aroidearum]MBA5235009.1 hypothetical protein [Pectobacterium aroidearum]
MTLNDRNVIKITKKLLFVILITKMKREMIIRARGEGKIDGATSGKTEKKTPIVLEPERRERWAPQ